MCTIKRQTKQKKKDYSTSDVSQTLNQYITQYIKALSLG